MAACSETFLEHLRRGRRYANHTLVSYRNDLQQFEAFLRDRYGLTGGSQADSMMVRSWFAELRQQGIAKSSFNRKRSALRSFYKYLVTSDELTVNPMDKVAAQKKDRALPVFVEEHSLGRLMDPSMYDDSFQGRRDQLLIELLYTTGIRLSELMNLRHRDLDIAAKQLRITGKGNKERILPLLDGVIHIYQAYCDEKAKRFPIEHDHWLVVTDRGKQVYPMLVNRRVRHYLGKITTRTKKSPHVMRHSFATHMLDGGADLNAIKELLGHANLSATQVYTHTTIEKIKHVYKQAHPKA